MRLFFLVSAGVVGLLALVLGARTISAGSRSAPPPPAPRLAVADEAAAHLAGALRFESVSSADSTASATALSALHEYLQRTFPNTHAALSREVVAGQGLLYAWRGTAPALAPIVLMGHMDVVPVERGTEGQWTYPPFAGQVAGGFIWGRGSLDDKVNVVAIMEAVEGLVARGYRPGRTILLAFGSDEEVAGRSARAIVTLLHDRGVRPAFVLDEGGAVIDHVFPGLRAPAALVGIAEKGYLSLQLTARAEGGHSSMPPRHTAVGILSSAIAKLEEHPLRPRLDGATARMLERVGPELQPLQRVVMANLWLFKPLVLRMFADAPATNAMIRTTTAPTVIRGGEKDNVLPAAARALVNFRLLPGDSAAWVIAEVKRTIGDTRVSAEPYGPFREASAVSNPASPEYALVARTIREIYPSAVVVPYLVVAGTDSRNYEPIASAIFRFSPMHIDESDLARIHGANERLAVLSLEDAVRFYERLIQNASLLPGEP